MNSKIYHIYAKDRCLFHSIKEEEFETTWGTLKNMVGLMKTDYTIEDLSYEELIVNKEIMHNSSH
jgi:type II restriction/modification system DNA methylase subunit YeeA